MISSEAIEIGKADGVLRQATALVEQAYDLICKSPEAAKHLKFDCNIGWKTGTWNKLNEEYAAEKPMSKDIYHWRAFDHFGLQYGSCISLDGMNSCSGASK